MIPKEISLTEVGPREGFQFEGIGQPDKISTSDKIALIEALSGVGFETIQCVSFVHPKQVPQMADAEEIMTKLSPRPGIRYTGVFLNDVGLKRALATPNISVRGGLSFTASETFSLRNQKRTQEQDVEMQRRIAQLCKENGIAVDSVGVMAAFGCNFEGEIPVSKVLSLIEMGSAVLAEVDSSLRSIGLADTMGRGNPELVRRMVGAVRERWPDAQVRLHLHDTRGLGIANVYAGLLEGVDSFDCAVGGLGGCPFAGSKGAAGNVCSEEVV